MNRNGRATVMLFSGVVVGRLIQSGGFGWFVQQRMKVPLLIAAVALIGFGAIEILHSWREESTAPESVGQARGPLVGWMLVLPLIVLIAVAPTALGAAAADRVQAFTPTDVGVDFEPPEVRRIRNG